MDSAERYTIWSVGHSNRSIKHFIEILHSIDIKILVDIRSHPVSSYCPQFNKSAMEASLVAAGMNYVHMPQLGGHVKGGFKPYMVTAAFEKAIGRLTSIAHQQKAAYMCAEADWKNCHRSLISAHLDGQGWDVIHIKDIAQTEPHRPLLKQS